MARSKRRRLIERSSSSTPSGCGRALTCGSFQTQAAPPTGPSEQGRQQMLTFSAVDGGSSGPRIETWTALGSDLPVACKPTPMALQKSHPERGGSPATCQPKRLSCQARRVFPARRLSRVAGSKSGARSGKVAKVRSPLRSTTMAGTPLKGFFQKGDTEAVFPLPVIPDHPVGDQITRVQQQILAVQAGRGPRAAQVESAELLIVLHGVQGFALRPTAPCPRGDARPSCLEEASLPGPGHPSLGRDAGRFRKSSQNTTPTPWTDGRRGGILHKGR